MEHEESVCRADHICSIPEILEKTAHRFPDKIAVKDGRNALSYRSLLSYAQKIGSALGRQHMLRKPVPILMEKSTDMLAVMLGVACAGGFYVPVEPTLPAERIRRMLDLLQADLVVTVPSLAGLLKEAGFQGRVLFADDLKDAENDPILLSKIRAIQDGSDLLYCIFTSGSTGVPKGIAVSSQAVVRFIRHFTELFSITEKDVIGNQAPFDFDVSVKDIYSAISTGATLVLIPRELFSLPSRLIDLLIDEKVTVLIWAVSALCLLSRMKGFDYRVPTGLAKVLFSGEVMPPGQLRIWQKALPSCLFVNLYGPTEVTCNCTYFKIGREYRDDEQIPIGKAIPGRDVFLLDDSLSLVTKPFARGELCAAGESLSEGYYRNEEAARLRFPTVTINGRERRILRTGDLGFYDKNRNLVFSGRKDFQIKHMGHRIELEEIERALVSCKNVESGCCLFDTEKNRLLAFYTGSAEKTAIHAEMKTILPSYMIPAKFIRTETFPLTKNGKTDRRLLMERYGGNP